MILLIIMHLIIKKIYKNQLLFFHINLYIYLILIYIFFR